MSSWVYLFSKFTPEALLFEALFICILGALYTAFFVLRKRRLGSFETTIPVGVVKVYLNELIGDAERLRAQLFGLLSAQGVPVPLPSGAQGVAAAPIAATLPLAGVAGISDTNAATQFAALEAKLGEQAKAMEALVAEKTRIEKELGLLKSKTPSTGAGGDPGELAKLQDKIKVLEGRLAEYSVIEDDLANLKRLQQENAQLKAALGGKAPAPAPVSVSEAPAAAAAGAVATAAAEAAPSQEPAPEPPPEVAETLATDTAPSEPAPEPAAKIAAAPEGNPLDAVAQTVAVEAAPAEAPAESPSEPAAAETTDNPAFEGLVDHVEQSLQQEGPPAGAEAAVAAVAEPSTSSPPEATLEKTDEDLVAEFEKMLNS